MTSEALQLTIRPKGGICIVEVSGDLTGFGILLYKLIPELINLCRGESPSILLDLHNVASLGDTEKASLVATRTEVKKRGGRFALLNISAGVARSLEMSKIGKVFRQFPSWKLRTSKHYVVASSERKRELAEAEAIAVFS